MDVFKALEKENATKLKNCGSLSPHRVKGHRRLKKKTFVQSTSEKSKIPLPLTSEICEFVKNNMIPVKNTIDQKKGT